MKQRPSFPLTVFYDGACIVCATEMEHYKKKDPDGRLRLVDISAPGFDPAPYGRSLEEFMARMHVKDDAGEFFTGVDAFPVIWAALPDRSYHLLGWMMQLPVINDLARWGYAVFARYRKYLPKRTRCRDETCHLNHRR